MKAPAQAPTKAPAVKVLATETEAHFDFRCTLNTKVDKPAPATLRIGYETDKPYLLMKFTSDTLLLARVNAGENGQPGVLREIARVKQNYKAPGAGTPLVVQWRDGDIEVVYDGRTILRRQGIGSIGMGSIDGSVAAQAGDISFEQPQFQPVEPVAFDDDFMRDANEADPWQKGAGEWRLSSFKAPANVANPFMFMAKGKPAIAATGRWFWNDYTASVAVRPTGAGAVGVVAFYQDAQNYLLFKWHAENTSKWAGRERQVWRMWKGKPELLSAAPGGYRPGQWYRIAIQPDGGIIKATIDGQPAVQGRCDLFGQGLAGLYSEADGENAFDDVEVTPRNAVLTATHKEAITPQFTKEQSMAGWASPKGEWVVGAAGTPLWHRGVYFGDHALVLKTTNLNAAGAKLTAIVGGNATATTSGYAMVVGPTTDGKGATVELLREGKTVVASTPLKAPLATPLEVKLERVGDTVVGTVGEEKVLEFADPEPLTGRRAGYLAQTATVAFEDARVNGGNVYDYTFYKAPTDWHVASGTWDVTSRWLCSPQWSWFSGTSERVAAIWNKRGFSGDFAIEVFASSKMDSPAAPYYLHPRDLNITVGGDGSDLATGYSFIFGGWNNTETAIKRGTVTVASTKATLLPMPYHAAAHHRWFGLRIEKTGDLLSYYIDRKLVLSYRDPKPLTGRQMALWTCGNGVMIARATVYFEKENGIETPAPLLAATGLPANPAQLKWAARNPSPQVRVEAVPVDAPGTAAMRAVNLESGGNFAVKPEVEPFDAIKTPHLFYRYQMSPSAAVNLYFKVMGKLYAVRLTGSGKILENASVAEVVGAPKVKADGKWHDQSLDQAAMLKPIYPNSTTLMVEDLFFGNLTKDPYLQGGFGANPPGANYLIRDFTLRAADDSVVRMVAPDLGSVVPATVKPNTATRPASEAPAKTGAGKPGG